MRTADTSSFPTPLRLDRTRQAAPQVFDRLREQIVSVQLAPGTVLSRQALQEEFGLSQTPIRDALMKLAEEQLVDVFPQHATRVTRVSLTLARQAHFLRLSIELEAVAAVAASATSALIERLEAIVATQQRLLSPEEYPLLMAADLAFHQVFYDAAGVPALWPIVRRHSGHIDRLRRLNLPVPGKPAAIVGDHRRILAAIKAGDPAAARTALRDHLSGTLSIVPEIRARYPQYLSE